MTKAAIDHGGDLVGEILVENGVKFLFTLCGGHISPILIGSEDRGIRVIDVRHEVTAVFAADAIYRLSGIPGVAAVTAGPGLTNTITAVKNAQMAESAIILLGGATATILDGRGSLQDIDQVSLMRPHVKWFKRVKRVKHIVPALREAFEISQSGVPGPVFVELPLDVLYPLGISRQWYVFSKKPKGLMAQLTNKYLQRHLRRVYVDGLLIPEIKSNNNFPRKGIKSKPINEVKSLLDYSKQPVMIIGSQAVMDPRKIEDLVYSVEKLNIPVYLTGMARGLMGKDHPLHLRHKRKNALNDSDLVILAGVPLDFRLDYGRLINRRAKLVVVNINKKIANKNKLVKWPKIKIIGKPSELIIKLAKICNFENQDWLDILHKRDELRSAEIADYGKQETDHINPIKLCLSIENNVMEDSTLINDGGDFISTISYIVQPRGPLRWLDPGPFGTLGTGAGFALAAKLIYPQSETWLFYGDGSAGYSLSEFDTFVRHKIPIIAVVGNDASWEQIARAQVELFKNPLGTTLNYTDYHKVVAGFGGKGFKLDDESEIETIIKKAKAATKKGNPVLINALIGKTDFRKGSLSV
ncbi:MAG: thiamine pyrophosphate-binding protein [Candidatus Kariarchaeaceae archaeon]|jgi:thiamine pyrophosphate-dependent acetolactate synthase large subunit-like protein